MNINRREIMNSYIQNKREVRVKELEEMFPEVSSMTIRRDLAQLESEGYIIRVRGGARSIDSISGPREDVYSMRAVENVDAKVKIAKKAIKFIETGRSIYIDSGTTMMCLSTVLPDEDFSILTSGPNIALEIINR